MNWSIFTDLCLGAAAFSVARDSRKTANYAKAGVEKLATLLQHLTGRVDSHDLEIARLKGRDEAK